MRLKYENLKEQYRTLESQNIMLQEKVEELTHKINKKSEMMSDDLKDTT